MEYRDDQGFENMDCSWNHEVVVEFVKQSKEDYKDVLTDKIGCLKNHVCKIYLKGEKRSKKEHFMWLMEIEDI